MPDRTPASGALCPLYLLAFAQVVSSLKERGIPGEYVLFPDAGQGWRKMANRIRSTVALVQWFDMHLNRR